MPNSNFELIELTLRAKWFLSKNIILCWTGNDEAIAFLALPYYQIGSLFMDDMGHNNSGHEELNDKEGTNKLTFLRKKCGISPSLY